MKYILSISILLLSISFSFAQAPGEALRSEITIDSEWPDASGNPQGVLAVFLSDTTGIKTLGIKVQHRETDQYLFDRTLQYNRKARRDQEVRYGGKGYYLYIPLGAMTEGDQYKLNTEICIGYASLPSMPADTCFHPF